MISAMLIAAMMISPDSPAATYDAAMDGFIVGIEDDDGPDAILTSVETDGCVTHYTGRVLKDDFESPIDAGDLTGPDLHWTIDWRQVASVAMGDPTFYAVRMKSADPIADPENYYGKLWGFVTAGGTADRETMMSNMQRIANATDTAISLHISCVPDAKAGYEAMGFTFKDGRVETGWASQPIPKEFLEEPSDAEVEVIENK